MLEYQLIVAPSVDLIRFYTSRREGPINDAPLLSKRKSKIFRRNIYTSAD